MEPETIELEIKNELGLHARPASAFVRVASSFSSEILVEKEGEVVNGKSLISLLMLAAGHGTLVKVTASGVDSSEALRAIENLVMSDEVFNKE